MAPRDGKPWHQLAVGGALVALGSVIVGAKRSRRSPEVAIPTAEERSRRSRTGLEASPVTLKPRPPEPSRDTQYWPPPAPPPIEGLAEHHEAEAADREGVLPVAAESEKLGYEVQDTRVGHLVRIMAFSVAVIVGSLAGLFYVIGHYHRLDARSPPLTAQQSAVIVPPGPRLQDHPLHDIAMEKKRESELLQFYAWTDASRRVARIPIARAEALVIGRPLDPLPGEDASDTPAPATGSPGPDALPPARPQP